MNKQKYLPSSTLHAWERFHLAVNQLTIAPGDVRSRLERAHFHLSVLEPQEILIKPRGEFTWIMRMLTRRPARWEGDTPLKAFLAQMRNRTGVQIAEKIVKVYHALDSEREEWLRGI